MVLSSYKFRKVKFSFYEKAEKLYIILALSPEFVYTADLTYANFEGNANPNVPRSEYPNFNYNPTLAPALKNAGVDLVSTANNHAIDTGPSGVDATLNTLGQVGLLHYGYDALEPAPPALSNSDL